MSKTTCKNRCALPLLSCLSALTSFLSVWSQISASLTKLRSIFSENDKAAEGLRKFTLQLFTPAAERIGWEFPPNEDYLTVQLRKLLIPMVCKAGHEGWVLGFCFMLPLGQVLIVSLCSFIAEAKRRFDAWATGKDLNAVHTNLRLAIFGVNVSEGGREAYDAVKDEYLRTDSVDGKVICMSALGRITDAALVKDYLDFAFSDKVAVQDLHSPASSLAANPKTRHLFWAYIKENWDAVSTILSSNNVVFERFIRMGLTEFADHQTNDDISAFFKDKDTLAYERALVIVSDSIRTKASYKERDVALIVEWLQAHDYV